jgi:hypothetical protein
MNANTEYKIIMADGYLTAHCADQRELHDKLRAVTFCKPNFVARVECRERSNEFGTPWHVCQQDMNIYVGEYHVGRCASNIYVLGNGSVVVGYERAVKTVHALGLFDEKESALYVQSIDR